MDRDGLRVELFGTDHRESLVALGAAVLVGVLAGAGVLEVFPGGYYEEAYVGIGVAAVAFAFAYRNGGLLVVATVLATAVTLASGLPTEQSLPRYFLWRLVTQGDLARAAVVYAAARTAARWNGEAPLGPLDRSLLHDDLRTVALAPALAAVISAALKRLSLREYLEETVDVLVEVFAIGWLTQGLLFVGLAVAVLAAATSLVYHYGGGYLGIVATVTGVVIPFIRLSNFEGPLELSVLAWHLAGPAGFVGLVSVGLYWGARTARGRVSAAMLPDFADPSTGRDFLHGFGLWLLPLLAALAGPPTAPSARLTVAVGAGIFVALVGAVVWSVLVVLDRPVVPVRDRRVYLAGTVVGVVLVALTPSVT